MAPMSGRETVIAVVHTTCTAQGILVKVIDAGMRTCPGRPYAPPPSRAVVWGDVTGGVAASSQEAKASLIKEQMMNLALWIAAGVLAAVLLVAATSKLVIPKEKLATFPGGGWVEDFSPGALEAISTLEILGAAGLILPAVLGIAPVLVPLAATGAALLFAGAVITRLRRGEKVTILVDLVYLALAVFVAWGRFGPESFHG
jgi:hypothetical protein